LEHHISAAATRAMGSRPVGRREPNTSIDDVPVIGLRRRIAQQMQESKKRIPHFSYVEEVDVTDLEDFRLHLNENRRADQPKLTLLPFIIRALVQTLPLYPQVNARFDDDGGIVHRYGGVHVGIATQTPNGLVVPVLRHAEARGLWDLANEIARLARATRAGTAGRDELSGSTITVTSLGPLGGLSHTPIINHPEVAILGPNKIIERVVVKDGEFRARKTMNISSSFDHRVVDGWDAASFIQELRKLLERPTLMFMDAA
jgi:2-oxoisovalerate dehydrogenase E2 component (dihydrolipoyl transacylase)